MQSATTPLLEHLRIFHSCDVEETRAFLLGKAYTFSIEQRRPRRLDARINGVYMRGAYIGYVQYGSAAVAFSPGHNRTDYWIQLPLHGHLESRIGDTSFVCDQRRAAIASPSREHCCFRSEADSTRIQLALTTPAVVGGLAALLGEPPNGPLDFRPAMDLTSGYGRSLARYVLAAIADFEQTGSVLWSPATMQAFEQFLVTALLQSHPHTYTDALLHLDRPILPRDVKRAIEYMDARLDTAITIADLVAVSGVPGRTLFKHFRDWQGVSPMQYLRNVRFRKVHRALSTAEPEERVTEIALSCGFGHMGRFSVEYRQRFGETPTETLKRQRKRR